MKDSSVSDSEKLDVSQTSKRTTRVPLFKLEGNLWNKMNPFFHQVSREVRDGETRRSQMEIPRRQ